jgi:phage gpG-like protein
MLRPEFKATRASQAIRAAAQQLDDVTPIYQDVVEYMIQATRERFATATAPDGKKWAPKNATTLERYKRLG